MRNDRPRLPVSYVFIQSSSLNNRFSKLYDMKSLVFDITEIAIFRSCHYAEITRMHVVSSKEKKNTKLKKKEQQLQNIILSGIKMASLKKKTLKISKLQRKKKNCNPF